MNGFRDNVAGSRFELEEGGVVSFCDYRRRSGAVLLLHVETPMAARGRGGAGRLMAAIVDYARAENFKLLPMCSYASVWMGRHPEHRGLLA